MCGVGDVDALDFVLSTAGICEPPEGNVGARDGIDREDLEGDWCLTGLTSFKSCQRSEGGLAEGDASEEVDAIRVVYKVDGEDVGGEGGVEGGVDKGSEAVDDEIRVGCTQAVVGPCVELAAGWL